MVEDNLVALTIIFLLNRNSLVHVLFKNNFTSKTFFTKE